MKSGVIDSCGRFHELHFYKIQELCEVITKTAITKSEEYKNIFETKYVGKVTRFSPCLEFCLHELGWMIYDPYCTGKSEVLFSNGNRCYVVPLEYVKQNNFNRHEFEDNEFGYPILTDEVVSYNKELNTIEGIKEGIVDEKGFVSSEFLSSLENLAQIELMYSLINNERAYKEYIEHKDEYSSALEYVTSKKNVISVRQLSDGTYTLDFVSENDGKVQNFIDALTASGKLAELKPLVQPGDGSIMKVA